MLKKKLLVTAMSMDIGGAEKSLVNLLNLLNCDVFDVDLLLFQRKGNFLPQVPEWVNILSVPEIDILYGVKPQDDISFLRKTSLEMWRYMATGTTRFIERQFDRRRLLRWQKFYSFRITTDIILFYFIVFYYCCLQIKVFTIYCNNSIF